ncbi:hypothetical protein MTO96_028632 [Rhipicephalus appendiculatus]
MRVSSDSSVSDEGPSCSTSAALRASSQCPRLPTSLDDDPAASRDPRSPSPPTAALPNRRRFLQARAAMDDRPNVPTPQEADASPEEEPSHSSRLVAPRYHREPRSRCTFTENVRFRCQGSPLRRNASLESVRWLEDLASDVRERFHDRRCSSPRTSGRQRARFIRVEKRAVPKLTLCSAVFLCVIVVAAFVLLLARKMPAYASRRDHVCSTAHCLEHARRLLSTLNASVDPCHDFHAYVCGGGGDHAVGPNDVLDRFYGSEVLQVLLRSGLAGNYTPTTTLKALIALEKCADRSGTNEAIEDFTQFMADRGIYWPAQALQEDRRAGPLELLDVLFDLSINWRVALWFDVSAAYSDIDDSFVVSVSEVGALTWHRMRQLSTLDDNAYAALARNMSSLLSNGSLLLDDEDLVELRHDETVIRSTILSLDAAEQHDLLVPLHRVGDVTGVISSAEWMALLKKHLGVDFNISSHTEVLLSNEPYLARIFALLGNLGGDRALNVTGWMFAYVYAWTAIPGEWFGLAHLAASFSHEVKTHERHEISGILNLTSFVIADAVANSRSVSNSTKSMAVAKIQTTAGRNFWPPEPFFHLDTLDVMYDNFPAQQSTFFAIWIKSRMALRKSLTNRYYGSLMTARYRWSLSDDGSSAMAYSGLGFQLARALVKTMDEHGRRLDYVGHENDWWESVQNCTWDLAQSDHEKRGVADLFALELALEAFKRSSESSYQPVKIRGLERLSEAQTFLISYCSNFCGSSDGERLCGLAANVSDFASAFTCQNEGRNTCLFV